MTLLAFLKAHVKTYTRQGPSGPVTVQAHEDKRGHKPKPITQPHSAAAPAHPSPHHAAHAAATLAAAKARQVDPYDPTKPDDHKVVNAWQWNSGEDGFGVNKAIMAAAAGGKPLSKTAAAYMDHLDAVIAQNEVAAPATVHRGLNPGSPLALKLQAEFAKTGSLAPISHPGYLATAPDADLATNIAATDTKGNTTDGGVLFQIDTQGSKALPIADTEILFARGAVLQVSKASVQSVDDNTSGETVKMLVVQATLHMGGPPHIPGQNPVAGAPAAPAAAPSSAPPKGSQPSQQPQNAGAGGTGSSSRPPLTITPLTGANPNNSTLQSVNRAFQTYQALANRGDVAGLQAIQPPLNASSNAYAKAKHAGWTQAMQHAQALAKSPAAPVLTPPMTPAQVKAVPGGQQTVHIQASSAPLPKLSLAKMTQVGPQGGSNPGGIFKDPATGTDYYVKKQQSDDHAHNEMLAQELYKAAGSGGLDMHPIDIGGGKLGTAAPMVSKRNLDPSDPADLKHLQATFGASAWLANWDAVLNDNTQMVAGRATVMDAGGALLFRAQGGPKGAAFGDKVTEFESFRDPNGPNPTAAAIFAKMTPQEIQASVAGVAAVDDATIQKLVQARGPGDAAAKQKLADTLVKRRDDLVAQAAKFAGGAAPAKPTAPAPPSPPPAGRVTGGSSGAGSSATSAPPAPAQSPPPAAPSSSATPSNGGMSNQHLRAVLGATAFDQMTNVATANPGSSWAQLYAAAKKGDLSAIQGVQMRTPRGQQAQATLVQFLQGSPSPSAAPAAPKPAAPGVTVTGGTRVTPGAAPVAVPSGVPSFGSAATPKQPVAPPAPPVSPPGHGGPVPASQLPPQPTIGTGQSAASAPFQRQVAQMWQLAQTQGAAAVAAFQVRGNNTYSRQTVRAQQALLAHLGWTGATPGNAGGAVAPPAQHAAGASAAATATKAAGQSAPAGSTVKGVSLQASAIDVKGGKLSIPSHPELEAELNEVVAGRMPAGFAVDPAWGGVMDTKTGLSVAPSQDQFVLQRLAQALGFNAPAQVVPKTQMDKIIAADPANEAFRAAGKTPKHTGKQLMDQFRDGPLFFGTGVYGHGTYAARVGYTTSGTAQRDSAGYANGGIPPGAQARLHIPLKQMKTVPHDTVVSAMRAGKKNKWNGSNGATGLTGVAKDLHETHQHLQRVVSQLAVQNGYSKGVNNLTTALNNESAVAMLAGVDAIVIPNGGLCDYVNVLNRGKLVVQKENHKE